MKHDEDRETLYLRQTKFVNIPYKFNTKNEPQNILGNLRACYVGFCGRMYFFVEITNPLGGSVIFWNLNDMDSWVEKNFPKVNWKHKWGFRETFRLNWDHCRAAPEKYKELFWELGAPVLLVKDTKYDTKWVSHNVVELNPNLGALGFQKVIHPYQAYQSIRMWLSNFAAPEKPIPLISNNDMIEAKGFDLRSSFRKEKKKK